MDDGPSGLHRGRGLRREHRCRGDIDVEHALPHRAIAGHALVFEIGTAADDAVEPAEAVARARDQPVEIGIARDVGLDEPRGGTEPFRDGCTVLRIAVSQDHGTATLDQHGADGLPDERGRSGDDRDAAVELAHDAPRRRRADAVWRPPRPPARP